MSNSDRELLDKIDLIRGRIQVSYKEAKEALERNQGNVVDALIELELLQDSHEYCFFEEKGNKVLQRLKELLSKGNATRVRLKKGDKVLLDIPATVGVVGLGATLASIHLAIAGAVTAGVCVASRCTLEIEKPDGQVEKHEIKLGKDDLSVDS